MANLKIGIIGDALDRQYAGIHYYTKHLIEGLIAASDPTDHIYVFRLTNTPLLKTEFSDKITEIVLPSSYSIFSDAYRLFCGIPARARKLSLDIVIEPAHFGPFNLPRSITRVTAIHDLTPIIFPTWHKRLSAFLQKTFLPRIIKRSDIILTNSTYTKQDIVRHIGTATEKIHAFHLGIDDDFRPVKDVLTLAKYGIVRSYFLFLGTIEPRKNIDRLLAAYDHFRDNHPSCKDQLILAGKVGWIKETVLELREKSKYFEDVIYLGYVKREDMPALYSGARVFVYPSLYEGFGLPILEALACGTPVVTSNNSSLPEVGGPYAFYADAEDAQEIADKIYLATHIDTERREAQAQYARKFTWSSMTEGIYALLRRTTHETKNNR